VIQLLGQPLEVWGTTLQKIQHRHGILLHHLLTHQFTATTQQVEIARQNVEAADEINSPAQLAEQLSSLGLIAFMAGEFDESIQAYNACLVVAETYRLLNILERAYAYLSLAYRRKKQPAMAAGALDRLKGVIEQTDMHTYHALEKAQRAWLAWRDGDYAAAQQAATQAVQGWGEQKIQYPLQWAGRMVLLALAVQEMDLAQATEHARGLFQPLQQRLSPAVDAALQIALDAGGPDPWKCWQEMIATAKSEGYL
jgi:tetratricopeptide (TPR) repeat protein